MQNSSGNSNFHERNDCWAAIFCGLVEILIQCNDVDKLNLFIPKQTTFAPIRIQNTITLLHQMIRSPNKDLFYTLINDQEANQIIKSFILSQYKQIAKDICTKELLQNISNTFKVDIIFLTYNTSISLSSSENLSQLLKVVQYQQKFKIEIVEKKQQTGNRSRSSSFQQDYILEMKLECNGCLRIFDQIDLYRSISCSHTYCKQCLKLYFKLGQYFICRDFFCKLELSREDFPFLQLSPLNDPILSQHKCLKCKTNEGTLYINKCGHTHCEKCIKESLQNSRLFQTHFCLEPSCTELLINELVQNNKKEINVPQLLLKSNSTIRQKMADFCNFCLKVQEQGVKNKCGHYYCKQCLQDKYQQIISYGLSKILDCPVCQAKFNVDQMLEEYYIQLQEASTPRNRSTSQQLPDLQKTPSQTIIRQTVVTTETRQRTEEDVPQLNRRKNSIDIKTQCTSGGQTPSRAMPSITLTSRGPLTFSQASVRGSQYIQRNPQFF